METVCKVEKAYVYATERKKEDMDKRRVNKGQKNKRKRRKGKKGKNGKREEARER